MLALFALVIAIVNAGFWEELHCNGGQECRLQFKELQFQGTKLHMHVENIHDEPIRGGNTNMTTEGYGCVIFFCGWQAGPVINEETCTYPGVVCNGNYLVQGKEKKTVIVDFTKAVQQAKDTTGCCSVDSSCGCMIRGVAAMSNGEQGEYARVSMGFSCNFKTMDCKI